MCDGNGAGSKSSGTGAGSGGTDGGTAIGDGGTGARSVGVGGTGTGGTVGTGGGTGAAQMQYVKTTATKYLWLCCRVEGTCNSTGSGLSHLRFELRPVAFL